MKLKLKTLVAAMAMVATGAVQAAISTDGWNPVDAGTGTGAGELFLSIYDPSVNQSLVLDLNLTVSNFMTNNALLINTFNVTDAGLQAFIGGSPSQSLMQWNLGAISNGPGFGGVGVLTTHGNAGATIDPLVDNGPLDGNQLLAALDNGSAYVNQNNPTQSIQTATDLSGHFGGLWAGSFGGGTWTWDNQHIGFTGGELMSFISIDESNPLDGQPFVTAFSNAEWMVNPTSGTVSYVGQVSAVPVPAAVWLFGSGLVGLVGISRRRKQA
jgi:hypothetical protein